MTTSRTIPSASELLDSWKDKADADIAYRGERFLDAAKALNEAHQHLVESRQYRAMIDNLAVQS